MFKNATGKALERLELVSTMRSYDRGNVLFYQGNRPLGLYFICSGRVKISKDDGSGRGQIVRIVEAPNLLGDRAFFAQTPYASTGEVMDPSQICFLETRQFWELFGQDAAMLGMLAQRFAVELGHAEEQLRCLSGCKVNRRMATHLLKARAQGRPERAELVLTESRSELAQLLGTTPEGVSRALAELCGKKLIALDDRRVRILNEPRLRLAACSHAPPAQTPA